MDEKKLIQSVLIKVPVGLVAIGATLFIPAGTLNYWNGWLYMILLMIPVTYSFFFFIKRDPQLLKKRLNFKEKFKEQKIFAALSIPSAILIFVIPGLDFRYGWSPVPLPTVILATTVFLCGYALFIKVLKTNSYASRTIEIQQGQKVISTGPYAIVRHPMYTAALIIYAATPIILGSLYSGLTIIPLIALVAFRIKHEEKVLAKDLPGYKEYMQNVKYRLIPGFW